ncbi:MAG: M48 family metalloprotease [Pseudomonadales bacterium]|nr:M48 family metalloprotease [Pseudomonadales bacterium]
MFQPCTLASELGRWEISADDPSDPADNIWSDYHDAKPDLYPDAWDIGKLGAYNGEEIVLRSSNGALLRWINTQRLKDIARVHRNIQRHAELKTDLYLTRGDVPNASAGLHKGRPTILINFAMLDLIESDQAMWAALLGHEIAHLKLEHLDARSKRSIPLNILKTVGGVIIADPLVNIAASTLLDGITAKYSRDAERSADYLGVIWAIEAKYDAHGAAQLHTFLGARKRTLNIPFMSTHPSSPERIKTLTDLAERLSK